jgi:SAM-dependent methyltransferase
VDAGTVRGLQTPEGIGLLAEVTARGVDDDTLLGTLATLRARFPEPLVAAAVTQVRLRHRAEAKFGADAAAMFFTADGMEQATRQSVAAHRARRYADAGVDRVLDLCCGVGGDLIALGRAGLSVHGVDRDELTVEVARANVAALGLGERAGVEQADVTDVDLAGWPAAFCDPARRAGGRRVFDPRSYSPPFRFLEQVAAAIPFSGAKVAPGIPHDQVPPGAEAEWVSDGGEVKEAALWFGPFATTTRRATLLPAGETLVDQGLGRPPTGAPGQFLYEPDGAVVRAHLVAEVAAIVGGRLVDPTIAYVTADRYVDTAFARAYEIAEVLPFSRKRLQQVLRARGVGRVTVKKRGSAVDTEALRRALRLDGAAEATVILTRVAGAPTALVGTPVPRGQQ